MKHLLLSTVLALLLLAPAARGGEVDQIEGDIRDVQVQMQYLRDELGKAEEPQKRAELQQSLENAHAHQQKLVAALVFTRKRLTRLRIQYATTGKRAQDMLQKATAAHNQVEAQRKALMDKGDVKRVETMLPSVQQAAQDLGKILSVVDLLEKVENHLSAGDPEDAHRGLVEAAARMDEAYMHMSAVQHSKQAAADAERAKAQTEMAESIRQAVAGIEAAKKTRTRLEDALKKASDPENVEEIKRIQERMAQFEEQAAKFHIAKGWLDKARAQFGAADIVEAQEAIAQAKAHLQKARHSPLDDGSGSWPVASEMSAEKKRIEELRDIAAKSLASALSARQSLGFQLDQAKVAGRRDQVEQLTERVAEVHAEASRLDAAHKALERARIMIDYKRYDVAKQAFSEAQARLAPIGLHYKKDASGQGDGRGVDLQTRIHVLEREVAKMKAHGVTETHPGLQRHRKKIEALRAELANGAGKSDRPFYGAGAVREDPTAALRALLDDLESQRAELETRVTDKHPSHIGLSKQIDVVRQRLAALEGEEAERVAQDEDGRYRLLGTWPGGVRVRLVKDADGVVRGGVVDEDGVVVSEPVTVKKTMKTTVRRRWTPQDAKTREQIGHLRQAAKHLREAGQTEEAERLDEKAKDLEERLTRADIHFFGRGDGGAQVMQAIGELRGEVRALRREVKELKELILEDR